MSKIKRIYVKQYDGLWSLTPRDAVRLLVKGARGEEWNLDDYGKRLKSFPSGALCRGEDGSVSAWKLGVELIDMPTDFEQWEYLDWASLILERM
jgi:hypothetical protein